MATVVISVLIVIAACIVCGVLVWRINRAPNAGTLGVTLAQLQAAIAPLPTLLQVQAAVAPLATTIQHQALATTLETLRADVARLSQDITLVKGSNDAVLNLVSHLVPGLPPQIASLEPASAAAGATIVLWGNNFLVGCRVWFGTTAAQPVDATDSIIRVLVPAGLTGDFNVYVQGQNGISAPRRFTITS
jgi:hypothetical protein